MGERTGSRKNWGTGIFFVTAGKPRILHPDIIFSPLGEGLGVRVPTEEGAWH